jgi:membrane protein DedA with SNARE-associated domain
VLASITSALVDRCTEAIGDHGWYAVLLLMLLESACIPIPSEAIMLFAGFLVSQHQMGFVEAVLAGSVGNLLGSWVAWAVGAYGGPPFIHRYGRYIHVTDAKLARAEARFNRYDDWAVPVGLATPLVRSFVAIPAGIVRVPFVKFLLLALVGCAAFCAGLAGAGWALGTAYTHVHDALRDFEYVVVAGVVIVAAYLVYVARVRRRAAADTAR